MIRYFYGEDTFAAREAIQSVVTREKAQVRFLDAKVLDEKLFGEMLERGGGGLFGKEMVVLREPSQLPGVLQEKLVAAARGETSTELILWDVEEYDVAGAVYKYFAKGGQRFAALSSGELTQWLQAEAQQRGVRLEAAVARMLVSRLGSDRWRLLSELERLSLQGAVTSSQVESEVAAAAEVGEVFELLKAVTAGRRSEAMRLLTVLLESGASEFYVVSMLAYQLRTLYLLAAGKSQAVSPGAARALLPVARRRPAAAWLTDLTRVVASDFAIKQGSADPRTGVIMLVLNLMPEPVPARA